MANIVDPDKFSVMSHCIWIYTVCKCICFGLQSWKGYCKTLIFGSHFILALLAVKEKNGKIKNVDKYQRAQENNKLAGIYSQYTLQV